MTVRSSITAFAALAVGLTSGVLGSASIAPPISSTLEPTGLSVVLAPEVVELIQVLEVVAPDLTPSLRIELAKTVVEEGARNDIEPLRLLAVISVESSFDPLAASSKQARGFLQLMDATRDQMAEREGLMTCDADPMANVRLGARYLGLLKKQFRGREPLALMAYNAGPQRLVRAIELREPALFRPYVNAVDRHHSKLKAIRGQQIVLALDEP